MQHKKINVVFIKIEFILSVFVIANAVEVISKEKAEVKVKDCHGDACEIADYAESRGSSFTRAYNFAFYLCSKS